MAILSTSLLFNLIFEGYFYSDFPYTSLEKIKVGTGCPPPNEEFDAKVEDITGLYINAIESYKHGERTISIDQMTGIQATERKEKDVPMRPGKVVLREFEYIRHGTQSLIANFDIATGKILEPICGDSRTESDFALNIRSLIESDPYA